MNEAVNKRGPAVGFFIVLGLLFLVGGVLTIGNLHSTFEKKITISTLFDDVNGLASGNNIWFSGVKIGTVKKTEFYGKSQVRVIMNITRESQPYIRKDAKVKLSTDGLIGNKILVIYGGSSGVQAVEEGDTLYNETLLSTDDIMKTFQQNNLNVLAITKKLANGEGSIGKLINSDSVYNNIALASNSLRSAFSKMQSIIAALGNFSAKLNKKGALVNDLVTDTVVFNSLKTSVLQLESVADTAKIIVNNLKEASADSQSTVGVLLHDKKTGAALKATINNLDSSSEKLDKDLEGLQHTFLLRRYFRNEAKKNKDKK